MGSRLRTYAVLLFVVLAVCQCDTARTIESPADVYFLKFIGDEGEQTGVDMEINPDGTFILFGTTRVSHTSPSQLYVVKADALGNVLWEKRYGGPLDDEARDVELTSDGRIVILGNTYQSGSTAAGGVRDGLLITLTANGDKIDSTLIAFTTILGNEADDDMTTVTPTNDGFIVAGSSDNLKNSSDPDGVVYKRMGLIARVKDNLVPYGAPWPDAPVLGQGVESVTTKIYQMPDGTFICFGYSKWRQGGGPQDDFNFWYFGMGASGVPSGDVNSFGDVGTDEKLRSVAYDIAGGAFMLAGVTTNQAGNDNVYYVRLRSGLIYQPQDATFNARPLDYNLGPLKNDGVNVAISQSSGYFLLTNEIFQGNSNFFLTKINNSDGSKSWTGGPVIYGGQGDDFVGAVRELPDGKIAIFGTMAVGQNGEPKMALIKANSSGQFSK